MLTLSTILSATPRKIKERARRQCFGKSYAPPRRKEALRSLTKSGGYLVTDQTGKYREFKYRVKCTDGWRKVACRFYGRLNQNTRVWVWCSCPYFKYHCEVALASKGSSSVVQSNGQRPRFTNPRLSPYVCKHAYLLFALAMRKRKPGDKEMSSKNQPPGKRQKRQTVRALWYGDRQLGAKERTIISPPST